MAAVAAVAAGMRIPIPGGTKAGGGIGGILVIILFVVLTQCIGGGGGGGTGIDPTSQGGNPAGLDQDSERYDDCKTGADANDDADCARGRARDSLEHYWAATLPEQAGTELAPAQTITFTGGVNTGCGQATSQVGPFYCPADQQIYLDTTFFDDVLEGQLGGQGGDFVEPYVLAHEYGHHIQNLLGTMGQVRTQQGPETDAVRLELQADCYAGMWTGATPATATASIFEPRPGRHRRGHRRRQDRRRRPDPAEVRPAGQPRGLDPRLVGAAAALVHDRLRARARSRPATRSPPPRSDRCRAGSGRAAPRSGRTAAAARRRYGATAGWRNFPARAPSPSATRPSAHSARVRAV